MTAVRAAIYLRISKDAHEDGLAIERQRGDCEAIAQRSGWAVHRVYSDTMSASKKDTVRPEYERMREDFMAGEFDVLICWDLDRLTRQPRQLEDWVDLAQDKGLRILTANGEADLATDGGRMFARIKAAVARQEVERKSARQKARNVQDFALGKPRAGRGRFGYLHGNIKADAATAPLVVWLFEHVAAGGALNEAKRYLTQATGEPFSTSRIRLLIVNRAYEGMVQRGTWEHKDGKKKLVSQDWSEAAPEVDRLVSVELAERARAVLADPTRRTGPGPEVRNLLSGIAKCGVCGSRMKVDSSNYICAATKKHPTMSKRIFESLAARHVFYWFVNSDATDAVTAGLADWMKVDAELKAATQERDSIQELYLLPGADKTKLAKRLAESGERVQALTDRLLAVRSADVRLSLVDSINATFEASDNADHYPLDMESWLTEWNDRPLEERRAVLRSLFRITLGHGKKGHNERAVFEPITLPALVEA